MIDSVHIKTKQNAKFTRPQVGAAQKERQAFFMLGGKRKEKEKRFMPSSKKKKTIQRKGKKRMHIQWVKWALKHCGLQQQTSTSPLK